MNVARMFGEAENVLAREVYNAFSESYNKNVSEMFGRLHNELEDAKGIRHTEYDERQYRRVAFRNRKQADAFFAYMQKYNVEAIEAPVKLNGQYLVEIPKQVNIDSIQDTTGTGSAEDGLLRLKEQKQSDGNTVATASELLENYYNMTGEEADEAEKRESQQRFYESRQSSIASELSGYIAGQMEGFGSVYFPVKRAIDTAVSFVGQTEEDFFQSEELSTSLLDKNAEKKYNPHIRTSAGIFQYQKAVVLNNDTVLIDGKVVTDTEIQNDVLAQHRSRIAKAEAYAGGHKLKDYSAAMRERMQHNARKIQAQIYGQEYVVKSVQREEGFLYFGGAMTEITEKMNTASVVCEMNREFTFHKTDADILERVKTGFTASGRTMTAEQEKFLTDVTNVIRASSPVSDTGTVNLSVYQREELDKVLSQAKYTVFAARGNEKRIFDKVKSGGNENLKSTLTSLSENEIKTLSKSMERFARTENISSAANSLNAAEKAVILKLSANPVSSFSETELETLWSVMQKYESEHTISKAYLSSIDEIRKNMNFNADELDMMEYIGVMESMDKVLKYEKTVNPDKEFSISDMYAYQFGEKGYTEAEIAEMGLTKEEVTQLRDFLENKESAMQYYNTLLAVEKDFGIKIDPSVPFSRERLLEVNKEFLKKAEAAEFTLTKPDGTQIADVGYQFVKADGSFDLEALKKLSAADMKAIGISEETRQMLLEINDPKNWGFNSKKIAGKAFQGWQKIMSKLAKDNPELQQVQQDFSMMQKTVKYTQKTGDAVVQGGKAAKLKIDAYKAKHAKYAGKEAGNGIATGTSVGNKSKKTENAAKKRKVNSDRNDKYIAKMEKKLERVKKSENGIISRTKQKIGQNISNAFARASTSNSVIVRTTAKTAGKAANVAKAVNTATSAISSTVTSIAMPVIGILLLLLLLMSFISMSLIVVISSITNMFEADTTETVAYLLYETMKKQEDEWVSKLSDMEDLYNDRENQRYGITYISYAGYADSLNRLCLGNDNKTLYINPFDTKDDDNNFVNFSTNSDLLTEVKGYDGKITTGISTNINIYNRRKEEENFDSGYSSIENGHTSNIRDIMAMIDIMYQFDTGTAADEVLKNIMGLDPAVIDWANGINNISTFFKWAKRSVSAWFEPTAVDPFTKIKNNIAQLQDDLAGNGTVSYKTIENYAVALFESSHQEETYLEVQFYDVKDLSEVNVIQNGVITPITELANRNIKQSEASEIGYCIEPVTNKFPVYWENNTPAPYVEDNNGAIRSTTKSNYQNNGFAVSVDVEHNLVGEKKDLCLWDGMGNNKETHEKIIQNLSGSACWKHLWQETETEQKTEYFESEWKNNEDEARAEVENKINSKRNEFTDGETYQLSNNNNHFEYVKVTKGTDYPVSIESNYIKTIYHYWTTNDSGEWVHEYSSDFSDDWQDGYDGLFSTAEDIYEYRATSNALIYTRQTEKYKRECNKHSFQYCGGHLNVHEQGVVFSATNEQIAMTGIAEPLPAAKYTRTTDGGTAEYNLAEAGYDTLRGKYIDVDYSSFSTADMGKDNKVEIPRNDIQGSLIAKMYGVNFWSENDEGLQWSADKSGIKPDVENVQHFFRDIFDVDCVLLKAKNVFPCRVEHGEDGTDRTYKGFKSWTTENMQAVLMKLSMDWVDLYGFEVPLEIGDKWVEDDGEHTTSGYTLTNSDVKKVLKLIKKQYGYSEADESQKKRLDAAELALSYVGRGHYSEVHTSHDFLSYTCNASCTVNDAFSTDDEKNAADAIGEVDYSKMKGSCTAGDNIGFINFIYNQSYADYNNNFNYRNSSVSNNNADNAEPADLLVRNYQDTDRRPNMSTDEVYLRVDIGDNGWGEKTLEMLRRYKESEAVIYIGTFSEETLKEIGGDDYDESEKYLRLSAGQKIHADVPVTVDLAKIGDTGTIYLHTEVPESQTDLNGETNYWWVMPENRTDGWNNIYSYRFGS